MAVNREEYINKIDIGLKANEDFTKFYANFKIDKRIKQKVFDYTSKQWDKKTRISKAKQDLLNLKNKTIDTSLNFTDNTTLNNLSEIYFNNRYGNAVWGQELKAVYKLYCSEDIGKRKIKDIRKIHIDNLQQAMEKKGNSKQTQNGCSPRTIKKVLVQILRPMLEYALENKVLDDIPIIKSPKQNKTKKKVTNAKEKLATLYKSIVDIYQDDGFYRTLFLFALYGRRWNEIRTLQWSDIDLPNNTYTIKAENNKIREEQTYDLPMPIRLSLQDISDDKIGLVFKSPITGKELYTPKKQLLRIKENTKIEELTMHYFRHILVSAMGEMGTANTILSASLGHTNLNTVNEYYLSANHTKGSQEANIMIEGIVKSD